MKSNTLNSQKMPAHQFSEKVSLGSTKLTTRINVMKRLFTLTVLSLLIAPLAMSGTAAKLKYSVGPTAESALAADQELANAMRDNDTAGIYRMLDKGWAVIATTGGMAEGPSVFPDGIKSGYLVRKTFSISDPRVRLYGNTAVVTTKVELSGIFKGKNFDVMERQTDVWYWKDGAWKCILTHETKILA